MSNLDAEAIIPLKTNRFLLRRRLGSGSFGVFSEAYDRPRAVVPGSEALRTDRRFVSLLTAAGLGPLIEAWA